MKYEFLLFDADNTVLDFDDAEENALRISFEQNGLLFDESVLSVYKKNNLFMWEQFELGLATKDEVLSKRFFLTFEELGLNVSSEVATEVSRLYEQKLHEGFAVIPHATDVLQKLQSDGYRLFIVSNGVLSIQNARMFGSGLEKYFENRFISEQVGTPKPQKAFFDYCFASISNFDKSKALIIGDSLTSDMQGGINAGIATCWFNPKHLPNNKGLSVTYEIDDLRRILDIV